MPFLQPSSDPPIRSCRGFAVPLSALLAPELYEPIVELFQTEPVDGSAWTSSLRDHRCAAPGATEDVTRAICGQTALANGA